MFYIEKKTKFRGRPFQPSTSAQLAGNFSVLPRMSPPTPTRCNPVALGLKPRESVSNLGATSQISYFNRPLFEPSTSAQLAGSASVFPRVSLPTPTRCDHVALGLKPRESMSNLGHTGQISYFNRIERKVLGSAVRALDLVPTSGKCQVASQGSPLTPTRCDPVALGFKPREYLSNLGPLARFRVLYRIGTKFLGSAVWALDLSPTSRKCQCASQDVPSKTY